MSDSAKAQREQNAAEVAAGRDNAVNNTPDKNSPSQDKSDLDLTVSPVSDDNEKTNQAMGRHANADADAADPEANDDAGSIHSKSSSVQAGVQKAMILRKAWSRTSLAIAFSSLFITSLVILFTDYSHLVVQPFVTSSFRQHSAMSAASVVNNIVRICAYPIIAKLSDVFGRAEMFTLSIVFQTLSYIVFATSQDIGHFIAAGLFDSIGATGFTLTQQIFIADATNLVNRAFWSTLPESITTLPALYLGSIIGEGFLNNVGWRWSYGTWAIITPIVAIPLIGTMIILQRRSRKHGLVVKSLASVAGCDADSPMWKKIFHLIWTEIDFPGLILVVTGLSLILVPMALTGSFNPGRWKEASFIAMLVLGVFFVGCFLVWDLKYAQKPYIPFSMVSRTVMAACAVQTFDFMEYTLFTIFFPSYLQVAGGFSPGHATRIDNSLRVAYQVSSLLVAIGMRYYKRPQVWLLFGPPLVMLGQGLMIYLCDMPNGGVGNEASFVASKVISGVGRAFWQTAAQVSVQASVSRQEVAVATGIFQAMNSIGGAFGLAIAGAIWRNTLPNKLMSYLPEDEKSSALSIFQSFVVAQQYEPGTPAREAINRSYRESTRILAIVSTCLCAPNLILMWFMRNIKLEEEDLHDEAGIDRVIAKIGKGHEAVDEKGEGSESGKATK